MDRDKALMDQAVDQSGPRRILWATTRLSKKVNP
jgi:hypothetical protein